MIVATAEDLKFKVVDKVATLTFNRPDKLNAMTGNMMDSAIRHLTEVARDPEIGAVILTGEGRAFCAGGDVSRMASGDGAKATLEQRVDGLRERQHLSWLLHSLPKLTIAAVNGYAMGAGLGIAMSCDLRIASDRAKFGTAYAKVGLGGDFGVTWQLTHLVGQAKAKEMFILAEIIEAAEAHRIGLVNRVVAHDDLMEVVTKIATEVAHGPLVSFRYMKENVNLAEVSDFRSILDREAFTHTRCADTDDHREGSTAFVEKRKPEFHGR